MDTHKLAAIIGDLAETDLPGMTSDRALGWLAERICARTGVEGVVIRCTTVDHAEIGPDPAAAVYGGCCGPFEARKPQRFEDLRLLGESATLPKPEETTKRLVRGPYHSSDTTLDPTSAV